MSHPQFSNTDSMDYDNDNDNDNEILESRNYPRNQNQNTTDLREEEGRSDSYQDISMDNYGGNKLILIKEQFIPTKSI